MENLNISLHHFPKKLLLALALVLIFINCYAQKSEGSINNKFALIYGLGLAKTNFSDFNSSYHSLFEEKLPLNRSVFANNLRFEYQRFISKNSSIGIFLSHYEAGQKSEMLFVPRKPERDSLDFSNTAGGISFQLSYLSNGIGLNYSHLLFKKNNISILGSTGISADFANKTVLRDYILVGREGLNSFGCCTTLYYSDNDSYITRTLENIKSRNFRIGIIIALELEFNLKHGLFVSVQPAYKYSSKIIESVTKLKHAFITDGNINVWRIEFGTGVKF